MHVLLFVFSPKKYCHTHGAIISLVFCGESICIILLDMFCSFPQIAYFETVTFTKQVWQFLYVTKDLYTHHYLLEKVFCLNFTGGSD